MTTEKKRTPKQTMSAETRFVLEELLPVLKEDIDKLDDRELFRLTIEAATAATGLRSASEDLDEQILDIFYGIDPEFHRETVKGIQDMIRHSGDRREWANEALKWVVPTVDSWNQDRQLFYLASNNFRYEKDSENRAWMIRGWWVFQVAKAFDAQHPYRPSNGAVFIGVCPRCGKIFKKNRSDQLYDRELCQKEHTRKK